MHPSCPNLVVAKWAHVYKQLSYYRAGCIHATYYRTLQLALGIRAMSVHRFLSSIEHIHTLPLFLTDWLTHSLSACRTPSVEEWLMITCRQAPWQLDKWPFNQVPCVVLHRYMPTWNMRFSFVCTSIHYKKWGQCIFGPILICFCEKSILGANSVFLF